MLKDKESFFILLCEDETDELEMIDIVQKISLREHIGYASVKIYGRNNASYIFYNPDKRYIFEMARNKKLTIVWKDKEFFGIISFKDNTKGDINYYLEDENNNGEKFEGEIITLNVKKEYRRPVYNSRQLLDDEKPYNYEYFCFYQKESE